jgi:hypothetical protein
MESPLRLTAHGGFGEGDGETRLSKGRKVRPVSTLRSGGGGREAPAYHNLYVNHQNIVERLTAETSGHRRIV